MKKKREKIKGRTAAVIGMVLLIVVSIPLGMGLSLVRARNAANEHFYGSLTAFSLLEDLSHCSGEAMNMATLAGKYLDADNEKLQAVRECSSRMEAAERPSEKAAAYSELTVHMNTLYNALEGVEMRAEDEAYREEIYADFRMYVDLVSYSEYNIKAAEFNETFRNAPGRAIGEWMGVKELELFA